METQNQDRRKYERYKLKEINIFFELTLPDRIIINNGKIYDVSCVGIGVTTNQLPEVSSIITLDFKLLSENDSIISLAKVVWIDTSNKRFGAEFVTPSKEFMKQVLDKVASSPNNIHPENN
jgi:hypothetical protein